MAGPYFVDVTTGNDGDSGLTEELAFATLGFAANTVAAGEKVWVKASASYTADDPDTATTNWEITTAGGSATPIIWEGYYATPGDGGIVTVDAQDTNTNAMSQSGLTNIYNAFKNFRFTQADGIGVAFGAGDRVTFVNCRFDNNAGTGMQGDNYINFFGCMFDNNTSYGVDVDNSGGLVACIMHTNGNYGAFVASSSLCGCILYENTTGQMNISQMASGGLAVGNTVDGNNAGIGILYPTAGICAQFCNNIIFDNATGIEAAAGGYEEMVIMDFNFFNSNPTNRTNVPTGSNDVVGTGDPFVDSSNNNYNLIPMSEAKCAGVDARRTTKYWDSYIAGHNPPVVP